MSSRACNESTKNLNSLIDHTCRFHHRRTRKRTTSSNDYTGKWFSFSSTNCSYWSFMRLRIRTSSLRIRTSSSLPRTMAVRIRISSSLPRIWSSSKAISLSLFSRRRSIASTFFFLCSDFWSEPKIPSWNSLRRGRRVHHRKNMETEINVW